MAAPLASIVKDIMRQRSVVRSGRDSFIVLPLDQWEWVEDLLKERASPKLLKSIAAGRRAHKRGRSLPYARVRASLGLT
ncbi:hypothetical protein EPN90_02050 [Patescibacteria group bacterium]|nr:MAG: hypothetical protein EPN90_02050 [Patescibacteria group bacterium]